MKEEWRAQSFHFTLNLTRRNATEYQKDILESSHNFTQLPIL